MKKNVGGLVSLGSSFNHEIYDLNSSLLGYSLGIHPSIDIVFIQSSKLYKQISGFILHEIILWNPSSHKNGLGNPKRDGVWLNIGLYYIQVSLLITQVKFPYVNYKPAIKLLKLA